MEKEEVLKKTDHYRCRLCGQRSPLTATLCTKPSCKAQLSLYGEIITGEDGEPVAPPKPPVYQESVTQVEEKPVKEKPAKEKKPKERPVAYADNGFMRKKTLLIWLNAILLTCYCVMAFCIDVAQRNRSVDFWETQVIMAVLSAVLILLAAKEKFVVHGIACFPIGFLSFGAAGGAMNMPGYSAFFFLAIWAAYTWLGVISFIGTSRRKKALAAEGKAPALMTKKVVLTWIDIVICILCMTIACLRVDAMQDFLGIGRDFAQRFYLIPCVMELVIAVLGILLAWKEKYVLRGVLLCACFALGVLTPAANMNLVIEWQACALLAALHIWQGVISFWKNPESNPKKTARVGTNDLILYLALTYLSSIPAGFIVTIACLFKFYSSDPRVVARVRKILCVIGTVVGFVIYLYALANYSHCDEALYTSIIGLITKQIMGGLL